MTAFTKQGMSLLKAAPITRKPDARGTLLEICRKCVSRVYTLATLYRLDGDSRWLERAKQEMLTACAWTDWHPPHFLDVAEMTHAIAIGYDWLYPALTPDERKTFRTAIVEYGLKQGAKAYRKDPESEGWNWWTTTPFNWNQVCNSGLTLGALAVADEEPELASFIITSALKSLPLAMASFAPDGGWAEGPGYWSYTVKYTVPLIAGLRSALGTDFGIATANGFDKTGTFRLYFAGPTGLTFNYADADEPFEQTPDMCWLARRFGQPLYNWAAQQNIVHDPQALDLLWYEPITTTPTAAHAPLDNFFRGVDVAFLRSAWEGRNALWVGFKGGNNGANHSHLDLGTFAFDALGERWVTCLGRENYALPDYFGKARTSYFRIRTEGQNSPLIDGANQELKAKAPLIAYSSKPDQAYAVADLTAGYAFAGAKRVQRGVGLVADRKALLIQDEISMGSPVSYQWQIHTKASLTLAPDGKSAILTLKGKTLTAHLLEAPAGAVFAEESDTPPPLNQGVGPQQNPNAAFRRLVVRLPKKTASARIAVLLSPGASGPTTVPIRPLESWVKEAPPLPALGGVLPSMLT